MSEEIAYPAVVTISVTDEVIKDQGLVILVNGALGDWAGTALLRVTN